MWAIYKYNLVKYFKSPSTWVILGLSCFIAGFLGGYLPYSKMNIESFSIAKDYARTTVMIVAAMTSFLSIFVSIFAGFKASSMYKDEVEDGTFLVMLSKPITRAQIIFGKWLALQTSIMLFTFITSFTFTLSTFIFDKGDDILALETLGIDPIKKHVFSVGAIMWGIIMLMGLIFSSVALLISTRLSVGTTIGFSIAIGIIIQVTTLIATFTKKDEYTSLSQHRSSWFTNRYRRIIDNIDRVDPTLKPKVDFTDEFRQMESTITSRDGIYNLGIATDEKDSFGTAWPFDVDFQLHKLSEYASNIVIPENLRTSLSTQGSQISNFGIEGISNKLVADHPLSQNSIGANSSTNADFQFIKNSLLNQLPVVFNTLTKWVHYQWWVLEQAVTTEGILPILLSNKMLESKKLANIVNGFPLDDIDADLTQRSELQKIFDADQKYATDHNLPETPLGYGVGDIMPADDILAHEWWINWYKLSQEISKEHEIERPSSVPGGQPEHLFMAKYSSLFNAFKTVYSSDYNLKPGEKRVIYTINNKPRVLSDINGITFDRGAQKAYSAVTTLLFDDIPRELKTEGLIEQANILSGFAASIGEASRPIGLILLQWTKLRDVMNEYKIRPYPVNLTRKMFHEKDINLVSWANADLDIVSDILGIAYARPDLLLKIESRDYVKKNTILYVYLAIALILVPISYLIVRRQDFR